ncbi:TetR/AcrR family transcriptional regulator [Erythrobacter colymbi]|uniref:TetR/AcrR family transcriptional regulator n=1 Tax=Erythrobacter colymbi TaxID=1161202 RepID=UPI000A37A099|nr:TetR/AcrR family transcriptional regulator [Erythrobacter colymbi]
MAEKRSRGRPREYNRDTALGAARKVFWELGYSATSVEALCEAMGISKPSLYAGFGNKLALYLAVLRQYDDEGFAKMQERLNHSDLATALQQAAIGAIDNFVGGGSDPRGCLLVATAVVEAKTDQDVREELRLAMERSGELFAARFRKAMEEEDFRSALPPQVLGTIFNDAIYAAALRARAGFKRSDLLATLDACIAMITNAHRDDTTADRG